MALPVVKKRHTVDEYLRLEAESVDRHEFHDGEILAMSGGTYAHSRINSNLIRALGNRLEGSPCGVIDSNMRVAVARSVRYVYPDCGVVCGEAAFDPKDPQRTTILNPKVILEVLSPSTEAYDRGDKFRAYRSIEALNEYVLVAQDRPVIETFVRQADGRWSMTSAEGLDAAATIASLKFDLPLAEVYAGVTLPPQAGAGGAHEASA
jgi:Uma2 family endonuclease